MGCAYTRDTTNGVCIFALCIYRGIMFFGKYHIVIIKADAKGSSKELRMRSWLGWLVFLFVTVLIACNIWLWEKYIRLRPMELLYESGERRRDEQNTQLLSLLERIKKVSGDLQRMERFDARLRHMMELDGSPNPGNTLQREAFFENTLPLHRPNLTAKKMQNFLRDLSEDAQLEEVLQQELMQAVREKRTSLLATPSIWPVEGYISSSFGMRRSPFGRGRAFHKGIDIKQRSGTPIVSTASGTVKQSGYDGAYGISVEVDHGIGIITKYAHMQKSNVKIGQWVQRGEVIGYVGSTGRSTGPHLHYEVRVGGVPVNPMRYILN